MSAIQAGTLAKIQDLVPGRIGDGRTWETAHVQNLIMLAARAAWEEIGTDHGIEIITLVADQNEYTLDQKFISVQRVEYSSGGGPAFEYDDYLLPATFRDFDRLSRSWRGDGGVRPELYTLLSAPGCPSSEIFIYPTLAAVSGEVIKVTGEIIGTTSTTSMEDVQDLFVVPYTMAMMYAATDVGLARHYMGKVAEGQYVLVGVSADEYATDIGSEYVEWNR